MIYGSVCSGIEAATVAWHPLGWKPAFFAEIEKYPSAVLKHWYPNVPNHGDFTTIQRGDYEPIDLLVGRAEGIAKARSLDREVDSVDAVEASGQ